MASVRDLLVIPWETLCRRYDPAELGFETTRDVAPLEGTLGQPRALEALLFGLQVESAGHNLFVAGEEGSGRQSTVMSQVLPVARAKPPPADWVYVQDSDRPDEPRALRFPTGRGSKFARDMVELVRALRRDIPRAFDSEEYQVRRKDATSGLADRQKALLDALRSFAAARGFAIETSEVEIVVRAESSADSEEAGAAGVEGAVAAGVEGAVAARVEIEAEVAKTLRHLRQLEKDIDARLEKLNEQVIVFVSRPLFEDLQVSYADLPLVLQHLEQAERQLPGRLADFWQPEPEERPVAEGESAPPEPPPRPVLDYVNAEIEDERYAPYLANVIVDHAATQHAPVVFERNPSFHNLMGRIDHRQTMGGMETDFRKLRAGALHRANGGFLVLRAVDMSTHQGSWEALKRCLSSSELFLENPPEQGLGGSPNTLVPQPIPLRLKVILIGSEHMYQTLYAHDEDFRDLFKVKVDFASEMEGTKASAEGYAAFMSGWIRDKELLHFQAAAVARVLAYGARLVEHQRKLSTKLRDICDLLTEASFWAKRKGHEVVDEADVREAIRKREYRSNLVEEQYRELFREGTILLDTEGSRIGQVNGLSVVDIGDYAFGKPSRVTASVSPGKGLVQSIEREAELSGPLHAKGVFTLTGYLAAQYGHVGPLSCSAVISMEQAYEGVEGDSASSTELYALLSALSGLPIQQSIAVTGSVNQWGQVQAVAGLSEKIEGFFALCKERGLNGLQGVMIPRCNIAQLMLKDEVVEAARRGEFFIWGVETIDEGIALLTGVDAGVRDAQGHYAETSVHGRVVARLRAYSEQVRALRGAANTADVLFRV